MSTIRARHAESGRRGNRSPTSRTTGSTHSGTVAGMADGDGRGMLVYRAMELVRQVFDESTLATFQGHLAIGHTHYSPTGGSRWGNAQLVFNTAPAGIGPARKQCTASFTGSYPMPMPEAGGLEPCGRGP